MSGVGEYPGEIPLLSFRAKARKSRCPDVRSIKKLAPACERSRRINISILLIPAIFFDSLFVLNGDIHVTKIFQVLASAGRIIDTVSPAKTLANTIGFYVAKALNLH